MIEKGRLVMYVLSAADANAINQLRTTGESMAARMRNESPGSDGPIQGWPDGAQAHIGTLVKGGDALPGIVVRVHESQGTPDCVNLQVWLDGTDTFWATARFEDGSRNPAQGTFSRV